MASDFGVDRGLFDPTPSQKEDIRTNHMLLAVPFLLLLTGALTVAIVFTISGTDIYHTAYPNESLGGSPASSNAPPSQATKKTATTVPTVTTMSASTMPSNTSSTTRSTTSNTAASTTFPMTTTTNHGAPHGTDDFDTTYKSESSDGTPGSPNTPLSATSTTTPGVPAVTTTRTGTTANTTFPKETTTSTVTSQDTPHSPTATTTLIAVPAVTTTMASTTQNMTISKTPSTTPSTTASTTSPMSTTTKNRALYGRPMDPKMILCTFGNEAYSDTVGPPDGVCDIIIFDFLYVTGRGTLLNRNTTHLRWFLNYAENNSRITEFGLGIDHRHLSLAIIDLASREARAVVQDLWNRKIRHYGLLKFPVHDKLVTGSWIAKDYIDTFKKLRDLQEINRAGKYDEPGYLIFGIGLYASTTGAVHGYLRDILQTAPINGVVIRTHLEDPLTKRGSCKITGPNVYANSSNTYEVSMIEGTPTCLGVYSLQHVLLAYETGETVVDALDYVKSHYDLFRGYSLMVSFSMSTLISSPSLSFADGFELGKDCEYIRIANLGALCFFSPVNNSDRLLPVQRVMHGTSTHHALAYTYDSPDTIKWKICASTKRWPTLQFGVALFSLEHEDGSGKCNSFGSGSGDHRAGYWRAQKVSNYVKNVIRNPNFLITNPAC